MILEVNDLHVNYGAIKAVKGISFYVDKGEIVTLIGANGAGKTSTLRAITGLEKVAQGSIHFKDTDITNMAPHKIVAMGITHVPEGRRIFTNMTVMENLQMGAIAVDEASGHFGTAHDLPSKQAATEGALAQCGRDGGTHCVVMTAYGNGCGALIAGDKAWQASADVTVDHAKQTGIATCKKNGNQECRVVYSDCSPGK